MAGLVSGTQLDGVRYYPLTAHTDARGQFTEVFAQHWDSGVDPTQWSVVTSVAGSLRGMHLHRRHTEYLMVVSGRMSVGLYDARTDSSSYRQWARYELAADEPAYLTFPGGLVHGWLAHEPTMHLQAVSEAYASYAEDDNWGCHWSDPDLGIEWPFPPTVVSERADAFPSLEQLLSDP